MWSALCGFEPLPHEIIDASAIKGADRGVMKLVGVPAAEFSLCLFQLNLRFRQGLAAVHLLRPCWGG
jgi:hypothetical protein